MSCVKIKVEEIVDHLSSEFTSALEQAVKKTIPGVEFNRARLFTEFRRAISGKCGTWEKVPDRYVKGD